MYTIDYLCPRESPYWQKLTEGIIWKTPRQFASFVSAANACNGLLYLYHSARVIDPTGRVVHQI